MCYIANTADMPCGQYQLYRIAQHVSAFCTHKSQTAAWYLPQRAPLQATSSNVKELSCQEVERQSPKLKALASQLQDGVGQDNAKILAEEEEARATKAQTRKLAADSVSAK